MSSLRKDAAIAGVALILDKVEQVATIGAMESLFVRDYACRVILELLRHVVAEEAKERSPSLN